MVGIVGLDKISVGAAVYAAISLLFVYLLNKAIKTKQKSATQLSK
jgi:hypothetical protein